MKISVACLDKELLWALDDVIGGLYSIDLGNLETKCAIDCHILFPYGKFEVLSLFAWKENYIVIVPLEVDKSWILYNKITGEIEYRKVIKKKCREILIAADQGRNQLYFFPLYKHDPILNVDLAMLTCSQMIGNWSSRVPDCCLETAWKGAFNGQYVFFPIKNTSFLVRMDCDRREVKLLELAISENVVGVDYAFEELWLLPISGDRVYQIDENGLIVDIVELSVEDVETPLPDFARIVVQKRYLFLLPYGRKGIYVYDKLERKTQIIPKENASSGKKVRLQYWEYCIRGNKICFLPYRNNYIEIDLDTLEYKEQKISYPNTWSDEEKTRRSIWNHISEQDSVIRENDGCDINVFLEYLLYETMNGDTLYPKNIQCEISAKDFPVRGYAANEVWDMVRS